MKISPFLVTVLLFGCQPAQTVPKPEYLNLNYTPSYEALADFNEDRREHYLRDLKRVQESREAAQKLSEELHSVLTKIEIHNSKVKDGWRTE